MKFANVTGKLVMVPPHSFLQLTLKGVSCLIWMQEQMDAGFTIHSKPDNAAKQPFLISLGKTLHHLSYQHLQESGAQICSKI
jgi:hypothetical protein